MKLIVLVVMLFVVSFSVLGNEKFNVEGVIEVEGSTGKGYDGTTTGDIADPTVELGVGVDLTDNVSGTVNFLYEDGNDFNIDEAYITYEKINNTPLFLSAGKKIIPFGVFDSNLISDPITLEMAETHEAVLHTGFAWEGLEVSAYTFNGDKDVLGQKNNVRSWGGQIAYGLEGDGYSVSFGAGYVNDLLDTDTISAAIAADANKEVDGGAVNFQLLVGNFSFVGEYVVALTRFHQSDLATQVSGARPNVYHIELGYQLEVAGNTSTFSIASAGSREAQVLGFAKKQLIAGASVEVTNATSVLVEWKEDSDYDRNSGGTAKDANTFTVQMALNF